jgi:hypothetical protein
MRAVVRRRVSPSMVVTLAAMAIALPGSAIAAAVRSAARDDTVQECVAQQNTVHRMTNGVDQATGGLTSPISQGVDGAVDGVDGATNGAVSDITDSIAPEGSVLIIAAGEQCPDGYAPQTVSGAGEVDSASSQTPVTLAKTKEEIADTAITTAGAYMVTATANITEAKASGVAQTVKCALVGADGQTIPGSAANGTIPIDIPDAHESISISDFLPLLPAGPLALDCKDPALPSTATTRAAHIASKSAISSFQCQYIGHGIPSNGTCHGGPFNGDPIAPPAPPQPPKATGNIQATSAPKPSGISGFECTTVLQGRVVNGRCIVGGTDFAAVRG